MSELRVFDMDDDSTWWLAASPEEALSAYMKEIDPDDLLEPISPREVSPTELDNYRFMEEDGTTITFREQLALDMAADPITPRLFASRDF